ncbi:unnamed protein product [Closterium sp. NIES-64]|nr:unnamed protein product [Closterium sp. NIES-64]
MEEDRRKTNGSGGLQAESTKKEGRAIKRERSEDSLAAEEAPPVVIVTSLTPPTAAGDAINESSDVKSPKAAAGKMAGSSSAARPCKRSKLILFEHRLPRDGHVWLKYGQKELSGGTHTRHYFRCAHRVGDEQCDAKRVVDFNKISPASDLAISYSGWHLHAPPATIMMGMHPAALPSPHPAADASPVGGGSGWAGASLGGEQRRSAERDCVAESGGWAEEAGVPQAMGSAAEVSGGVAAAGATAASAGWRGASDQATATAAGLAAQWHERQQEEKMRGAAAGSAAAAAGRGGGGGSGDFMGPQQGADRLGASGAQQPMLVLAPAPHPPSASASASPPPPSSSAGWQHPASDSAPVTPQGPAACGLPWAADEACAGRVGAAERAPAVVEARCSECTCGTERPAALGAEVHAAVSAVASAPPAVARLRRADARLSADDLHSMAAHAAHWDPRPPVAQPAHDAVPLELPLSAPAALTSPLAGPSDPLPFTTLAFSQPTVAPVHFTPSFPPPPPLPPLPPLPPHSSLPPLTGGDAPTDPAAMPDWLRRLQRCRSSVAWQLSQGEGEGEGQGLAQGEGEGEGGPRRILISENSFGALVVTNVLTGSAGAGVCVGSGKEGAGESGGAVVGGVAGGNAAVMAGGVGAEMGGGWAGETVGESQVGAGAARQEEQQGEKQEQVVWGGEGGGVGRGRKASFDAEQLFSLLHSLPALDCPMPE